jgi:hypothetical protein
LVTELGKGFFALQLPPNFKGTGLLVNKFFPISTLENQGKTFGKMFNMGRRPIRAGAYFPWPPPSTRLFQRSYNLNNLNIKRILRGR